MERVSALRKPRLGALVEFIHGDFVHSKFNFGQVQASRPQAFNFGSANAAPIGGPIQKDIWKSFPSIGDTSARIPISTNVTSNAHNIKNVPIGTDSYNDCNLCTCTNEPLGEDLCARYLV